MHFLSNIKMRVLALLPSLFGLPAFAALIHTQYPELLVPLKKAQPDNAISTQKDAIVSYNVRQPPTLTPRACSRISNDLKKKNQTGDEQWTAVSFHVPDNNANICRLRFLVNTNPVKNPPFYLNGEAPFTIDVSRVEPKLVNGHTT